MSLPLHFEESSSAILQAIDIEYHAQCLGWIPHEGQLEILDPYALRVLVCACRQYGKSTTTGIEVQHTARFVSNRLSLIISPSEKQSAETMGKVYDFLLADPGTPALQGDNKFEKVLANGSRVVALPGSERSVRGYSRPRLIILDEAARIFDETYKATRPMLSRAPDCKLVAVSTPFGKRGFFWEAWDKSTHWKKILVRVAWEPKNGRLVPAMPEDEFRDYWAQYNVKAFYSPEEFHSRRFLEEELDENGEEWFRQEYCCEFVDPSRAVFRFDDIMAAQSDRVVELLTGEEAVDEYSGDRVVEELEV